MKSLQFLQRMMSKLFLYRYWWWSLLQRKLPFIKKEITDKNKEKIKDYLELNTALKDVIYKQKEDYSDDEVKKAQEKLNEVYDNFSKKHGFINNLSNTRALKEDSNFPLVSSIEILDEEENVKAKGIFSQREPLQKPKS